MKLYFKFSILFLTFIMLAVSSCKEDEVVDIAEANRTKILGNWKATALSQSNCNDPEEDIDFVFEEDGACFEAFPGVEVCVTVNFTFKADGTIESEFITTSPLGNETTTSEGSWEILDATRMTVCLPDENNVQDCSTGTYAISGNTLTYSGSDSDTGCDSNFTAEKQ